MSMIKKWYYFHTFIFILRYGEFSTLKELLVKYVKTTDKVLIPGCGTSELGLHMHDYGFQSITCTDIIQDVIERMKKYCDDKLGISYQVMDIFKVVNSLFSINILFIINIYSIQHPPNLFNYHFLVISCIF